MVVAAQPNTTAILLVLLLRAVDVILDALLLVELVEDALLVAVAVDLVVDVLLDAVAVVPNAVQAAVVVVQVLTRIQVTDQK